MNRRLRAATIALTAVLGGLTAGPAAAQTPTTRPSTDPPSTVASIQLEQSTLGRGQTAVVVGAGWPANTMVQVQLCGQNAIAGSGDCDLASSRTVATMADGRLRAELLVTAPPVPCPCVIQVFVPSTSLTTAVPITIPGVRVQEPDGAAPANVRRLDVVDVAVNASGSTLWSRDRTVRVQVRNTGDVALRDAAVLVRWGRGDGTRVVRTIPVATIEPGATATVRGSFELDGFTYGRFRVSARPVGLEGDAATASTDAPVAELAVAPLALALLIGAQVIRRRRRGSDLDPAADPADSADPADPADPAERGSSEAPEDDDSHSGPSDHHPTASDDATSEADASSDPAPAPFAGAGSGNKRVLSILLASGLAFGAVGRSGNSKPEKDASPKTLCDTIRSADPGHAIGGESLAKLVVSVGTLVSIESPPKDLAPALRSLEKSWEANQDARTFPDLSFGDDGYDTAYQSAYRLRFSPGLRSAAAVIEDYGVTQCGLIRSGKLELPNSKVASAPPSATLDMPDLESMEVDFDDVDFSELELPDLEIPTVAFDVDSGQFRVETPGPEAPDLSDREGKVKRHGS